MPAQLHETLLGRKLIESVIPDIAHQLERIATALEKKKQEDEIGSITSAFKKFISNYPDNEELGKQIRQIWEK